MLPGIAGAALLLPVLLGVQGCAREMPPAAPAPPAASAPEVMVPPEAAPSAVPAMQGPTPDSPIQGYEGFGPAAYGADEELVRMAWGRPLIEGGAASTSCRELFPEAPPGLFSGLSFMLVDGKLARLDVRGPEYAAPEGGRVGDAATAILDLYAGRIETQPHKYVAGAQYLVVTPSAGTVTRVVFETDANGVVASWRIGLPPAIFQVEGCA